MELDVVVDDITLEVVDVVVESGSLLMRNQSEVFICQSLGLL